MIIDINDDMIKTLKYNLRKVFDVIALNLFHYFHGIKIWELDLRIQWL